MKTPPTDPSPSPQQEPEWGPGAGAPGRVCGQGTYRVAAAVSAATLRTAGTTVVGERASRRCPPGGCVGLPHHVTSGHVRPRPSLAGALSSGGGSCLVTAASRLWHQVVLTGTASTPQSPSSPSGSGVGAHTWRGLLTVPGAAQLSPSLLVLLLPRQLNGFCSLS